MARYMRKGVSEVHLVPTIGDLAAPTAAEITAGEDLTPDLAEINGVTFANQPIDVPDFSSAWTKKIPGEDQADDPQLTFYEDDASATIRDAQAKGTEGYLVFLPEGNAAAAPTEVWPVIVASNSREWSAGNDPARYQVTYSVTDPMVPGARGA